jgi:protein-S-isoprenylcysteine O-methyltransferase Ste14
VGQVDNRAHTPNRTLFLNAKISPTITGLWCSSGFEPTAAHQLANGFNKTHINLIKQATSPRSWIQIWDARVMRKRAKQIERKPSQKTRLGAEHPDCDRIQAIMITLFFAVWAADSLILNYSTLLIRFIPALLRASLSAISLGMGVFLALKSHREVFGKTRNQPKLLDSGIYSQVRHPMYLGTLLFCLGFFFAIPSLLSLAVLGLFFILYDRMATYEEKDLISKLGEEYVTYQKRVPKWLPLIKSKNTKRESSSLKQSTGRS